MPDKTALQQLIAWIEKSTTSNTAALIPLTPEAIHKKALLLLPVERDAIAKAWDDGFVTGCVVGGNDYTNGTSDDTGEQYYRTKYGETDH